MGDTREERQLCDLTTLKWVSDDEMRDSGEERKGEGGFMAEIWDGRT